MTEIDALSIGLPPAMSHNWGWFLAFGLILLALGVAAILRSFGSTIVSMAFFGWLLLFAGFIEFVDAFMVGKWAGFFLRLLIAIMLVVAGALMVAKPLASAEAATLFMSMFLLIGGVYQVIYALWTHLSGWGWHALNGGISSILGILLLAQWPVSGLWAIGLFVGIDLVFYGWACVALAFELHKP